MTRTRRIPYREGAAIAAATAVIVAVLLTFVSPGGRPTEAPSRGTHPAAPTPTTHATPAAPGPTTSASPTASLEVVGVGEHVIHLQRTVPAGGHALSRSFDVIVRYPITRPVTAPASADTIPTTQGFGLIVFGHGFAVSPAPYRLLLDAWARAGFVVAAPVFPLENANAPGGPNESDLPNQPGDMSAVISEMLRTPAPVPVPIDPNEVAVAGQSDGGDTALATAYDPTARDPRVDAAIILSGAEDPFARPFAMPPMGPPLLAIQGTADTINPPSDTNQFFGQASPPKYLLKLIGAGHQPPYTEPGSDLTTVEHMTIAFLNAYFRFERAQLDSYVSSGNAGPNSQLLAFQ